MIACQLRVGSRIGLVWRTDRVELIIDAVHTLTLAKDICAPFVRIKLNGHITKMKLLPESKRSRIWSPNSVDINRPTLGMLAMRQRKKNDDFAGIIDSKLQMFTWIKQYVQIVL